MKHLLSIEAMDAASIETILENATVIKAQRGDSQHQPLAGQTWAMIFTKSSTRTRVSFETGIRELGGVVFSQRERPSSAVANPSRTPPACSVAWCTAQSFAPSRRAM